MVDDRILAVQVHLDLEFVERPEIPEQFFRVQAQSRVHVHGTQADHLSFKLRPFHVLDEPADTVLIGNRPC